MQKFSDILLQIANKSIPKTSTNSTKIKKPWFTDECHQAITARKKADRLFNRSPTSLNLNNFCIYRAKAGRTINCSKRKSWKTYVSSLNSHTPINKVWNAIRRIKGKGSGKKYQHLKIGNKIITDKKDISNTIANTISKNSSKDNVSQKFTLHKRLEEQKPLDFTSENNECYNEPFTYDEILQSLEKSHDTAVGPDQIHYQLIKHLPRPAKECLLQILTLSGKVGISHLHGHRLQLSLSLNKERIIQILIIIDQ